MKETRWSKAAGVVVSVRLPEGVYAGVCYVQANSGLSMSKTVAKLLSVHLSDCAGILAYLEDEKKGVTP